MAFKEAVRSFAPQVNHLHIHDSLGRPKRFSGYTPGGNLGYGLGDLPLPFGWGNIGRSNVLSELPVRPNTIMTSVIRREFWSELPASVAVAGSLMDLINGFTNAAE